MAKRVLIVDDALFMRNLLRDIFASAGWEVVAEAENGVQAIEQFKAQQPDLVTMDIVMPEMNGIDAMKTILTNYPTAKVIICSALGQESMVLEAIKNGAKDFIVKPFQDQQVMDVVARVSAA